MQITFDPLNPVEVRLVRRIVDGETLEQAHRPTPDPRSLDNADKTPGVRTVTEILEENLALAAANNADEAGRKPVSQYWQHPTTGAVFCADWPRYEYSAEDGTQCTPITEEEYHARMAEQAFRPDPSASAMPALGGVEEPDDDPREEDSDPPADDPLDSAGLPWDARIHAGTRTKLKANGRWKPKRGVEPELVATVEAELRAVMAIPTPGASIPPPPPAVPPVPPPPAGAASSIPPPPPVTAGSAGPASADDPKTFPALMQWIGPRLTAKTLTHDQVREAVQAEGLPSVEKLMARPDLIPLVVERLKVPV